MYRLGCAIVLTCLVAALSPAAVSSEMPTADVASREWIRSWILCGPFDNPLPEGETEYRGYRTLTGFQRDYLEPIGGESGAHPAAGLAFNAPDGTRYSWKRHTSPEGYVDLESVYDKNRLAVAYAACRLVSDRDQEVWLGLGTDDGAKAWLNGELVWWNQVPRAATPDEDLVRLRVKNGANLLLLKVDQGAGDWGFFARVVDRVEMAANVRAEEPIKERPLELTITEKGNGLEVRMGRLSRHRILGVRYTVTLRNAAGESARFGSAPLGESVPISCTDLEPGPYWLDCVADTIHGPALFHYQLGWGRRLTGNSGMGVFYHHGRSNISLKHYGRDGRPSDLPIMLLDESYEVVENAFSDDVGAPRPDHEVGLTRVLRTDVSPFRVQVLVDSASLGRRWWVADNEGKGHTAPASGTMTLDLPLEAARSLRARIERTLDGSRNLPKWMRQDLRRRLDDTAALTTEGVPPGEVYAMLDRLATFKHALPSDGPVMLWAASGLEKIAKTEQAPEYTLEAAHVSLARNEYEPLQIVLASERPLDGLTVEFEPFKTRGGRTLAASNLDVNLVEYVEIETPTKEAVAQIDRQYPLPGYSFGTAGPWPDPLPPIREPFAIAPGENRPLWVTVYAPKDQRPGVYRGALRVMYGEHLVARAPIEVEVFDFTLPDETTTETSFGTNPGGAYAAAYFEPLTPERFEEVQDLIMLMFARHRVAPNTWNTFRKIDIQFAGDPLSPVIDFTEFDATMTRHLDELKFNTFCMGGPPPQIEGHPMYSEEYNRLLKAAYGEVEAHLREKGWLDKAYWYWIDEPNTDRYPSVRQHMELVKWACPGIRRLLTLLTDPAPVPYLYGAVDLWVPSTHTETNDIPDGAMMGYDAELAHARQALGETVWWYTCNVPMGPYTNFFIDNPAINYRIHFWMMDKFDVDGFLYWATLAWPRNPWENAMATDYPQNAVYGNGAGWFLYPARRSALPESAFELPITSIRFEAVRDGIEDREYLAMLEQIAGREGKRAEAARDARAAAHRELARSMTCYEQAPALLLAARYRVAGTIEAYREAQ